MASTRSRLCRLAVKRWIGKKICSETPLEEQRAIFEKMSRHVRMPAQIKTERVMAGNVPGVWLSGPDTASNTALLYMHGGGYALGLYNAHLKMGSAIALAGGVPVLFLDYRLAPEHPFPAALDDVTAAYHWLLDRGLSPKNIALGGDSAGGGLTMAALLSLRDTGTPLPAAALCLSPWVDLELTGESVATRARVEPLVELEWARLMAANYADGNDLSHPLISPVHADLQGLPPLLIHVGDEEILLSDSQRLADQARQAGVDVSIEVWEKMWHVWHLNVGLMPESGQAIDKLGTFLRKNLT